MSGPRWWPTTSLSSVACDQAEASAALSRSGKLAIASPSSCPRLRRQALSGANCTFDQAKFRKYIHNPGRNIAPNSQPEGKTTRLWTETRLALAVTLPAMSGLGGPRHHSTGWNQHALTLFYKSKQSKIEEPKPLSGGNAVAEPFLSEIRIMSFG